MATKKKMLQAAAGNAGGEALNIEEVFSTYLYEGNGSTQTITNGIDLEGEGGLAWFKTRNDDFVHALFDTERGANKFLRSNGTDAETDDDNSLMSFNSNGFSLSADGRVNALKDYASWTFRKAPKFFDVVTYTGTGSVRTVNHSLGSAPGFIIIKETSGTAGWYCYHRSLTATDTIVLNETGAASDSIQYWNNTEPTDSVFTVGEFSEANDNGQTYVAYLFAHNDGDGEFGADGDADIIKCGSYTGTDAAGNQVDLGFEPQFVIVKSASTTGGWGIYDTMRGFTANAENQQSLLAHSSSDEVSNGKLSVNATGFALEEFNFNSSPETYIYIAIRRGPMAAPTDAADVFDIKLDQTNALTEYTTGFPIDLMISGYSGADTTSNGSVSTRLQGFGYAETDTSLTLLTHESGAEQTSTKAALNWDNNTGFTIPDDFKSGTESYHFSWRRAPGFFDVVAYEGNGTTNRDINHSLQATPDLVILKCRSSGFDWVVWSSPLGFGQFLSLNKNVLAGTDSGGVFGTGSGHSNTTFQVGNSISSNRSGEDYIAYLFSTLAGISKIGSYTGNGTSQTIDCGFTSGARFILVKRTDSTGDWYVWDTERGIVAGNDPYLELNTTDAEVTSTDWVDPDSSGFIVNGTTINASSASYIFYAIA